MTGTTDDTDPGDLDLEAKRVGFGVAQVYLYMSTQLCTPCNICIRNTDHNTACTVAVEHRIQIPIPDPAHPDPTVDGTVRYSYTHRMIYTYTQCSTLVDQC